MAVLTFTWYYMLIRETDYLKDDVILSTVFSNSYASGLAHWIENTSNLKCN